MVRYLCSGIRSLFFSHWSSSTGITRAKQCCPARATRPLHTSPSDQTFPRQRAVFNDHHSRHATQRARPTAVNQRMASAHPTSGTSYTPGSTSSSADPAGSADSTTSLSNRTVQSLSTKSPTSKKEKTGRYPTHYRGAHSFPDLTRRVHWV